MADKEKLNNFLAQIMDCLRQAGPYVLQQDQIGPQIQIADIEDYHSFNMAIELAAQLNKSGTMDKKRLGIIDPQIPEVLSIGGLSRGETVVFEEESQVSFRVTLPYFDSELGSLAGHEISAVPKRYIRPVGKPIA